MPFQISHGPTALGYYITEYFVSAFVVTKMYVLTRPYRIESVTRPATNSLLFHFFGKVDVRNAGVVDLCSYVFRVLVLTPETKSTKLFTRIQLHYLLP